MKGLVFHQQLEIRLEVDGEEFRQGDRLPCRLSIKNRGTSPIKLAPAFLQLATGDQKHVKAKDEQAFKQLAAATIEQLTELAPGADTRHEWTFELDRNCLVSDKAKSLYLVYGLSGAQGVLNHLQLSVLPHRDIDGILVVFETSFQFVPKGYKSKGDWVVAKLKPPSGQEYPALEELELSFKFIEDKLHLQYTLKCKKLSASPSSLEIQKKQLNVSQELLGSDYKIGDYIDPKLLEPKIAAGLSGVSAKFGRSAL